MDEVKDTRIPVTIITGFLGAGKTTLLNNLISSCKNKKFAIIENEFGEINIDSDLVVGVKGENIYELSNGCVCCTLNKELIFVLNDLLSSDTAFNHLLIETTGIADPASVVQPFILDHNIQMDFRLDSVICLIDTRIIEDILNEQPEAFQQIAYSDTLILNKINDVTKEKLNTIKARVQHISPLAKVYETNFSDVSNLNILDTFSYEPKSLTSFSLDFSRLSNYQQNYTVQKQQVKKHEIDSYGFVIPGNFNETSFMYWLDAFLEFNQKSIFRIKGILSVEGNKNKIVLQAVRDMAMVSKGEVWTKTETRNSKLVFIGKGLKADQIEKSLHTLIYESNR